MPANELTNEIARRLPSTYAKLCKIIGAEHPRLHYMAVGRDPEVPGRDHKPYWALYHPSRGRVGEIDPADAAALINEWVGDWWLTQTSTAARSIVRLSVGEVGLFLEGEHWLSAPTVAEAVLAACEKRE